MRIFRLLSTLTLSTAMITMTVAISHSLTSEAKGPTKKQKKFNRYVELLNDWSPFMHDGWKYYTKWANPKTLPTCKEKGIRPPSVLGDSAAKTLAELKKSFQKGPKMAADKAALAMVDALQKIRKPIGEAGKYYRRAYRKDDGCTLGKKLHPILIAAWTQYFQAEPELRKYVTTTNDNRAAGELKKTLRKYGKKNRYHYQKLIIDGKALIRTVDAELQKDEVDLEPIKAALATFSATQTKAVEIIKKANKRDADVLYQGNYKQMADHYAEQVVRTVERLIKVYPKRNDKGGNRLELDIKAIFSAYNQMINSANSVGFSKRIK